MMSVLIKALFGLAPALLFLLVLILMDSYKLVRVPAVLAAIAAGGAAMVACFFINPRLLDGLGLELQLYARYLAPICEELGKAFYIALLIYRHRIGFAVDALILGFAVGAGFGMLENLAFLWQRPDTGLAVWLLRGFGTAIMHGGTTAVFAVVARTRVEPSGRPRRSLLVVGLALAMVLHSLFNHFLFSVIGTVFGLVVMLPLVVAVVFRRSETETDRWLGLGFDTDAELFVLIRSGEISATPVGSYLHSLKKRFGPEMVADILCLLRLEVELAIQAKGLLLMRKGGFKVSPPPGVKDRIAEVTFLEHGIGRTGRLALGPFLRRRQRGPWQRYLLGQG